MATVTIPLTQGKVALIDEEDLPKIQGRSWWAAQTAVKMYAATSVWVDGQSVTVYMHQLITGFPPGTLVDHRNGDGLDCRRENMRPATWSQNAMNRAKTKRKCTSRFKGVHFRKERSKSPWQATIRFDGKQRPIGCFETEEDAARAYNAAAIKHFGEFARINIIEGMSHEEMVTAPDRRNAHEQCDSSSNAVRDACAAT